MRILAWIVLVAWVSTFFRTILNLRLIRHLPLEAADDGPLVSVIIPARNEERDIERTIRALLGQSYRSLEIIVVDDHSTDATPNILAALADPRLGVTRGEETPPGWLGKPWALHQGSRHATGEILLFIDADIIYYSPRAISRAVAGFREAGVPMIALMPHFEMETFWEKVAMPMLAVVVMSFLPIWLSNRTRLGFLGIGAGTGNMISRGDYDAIGGHEALKDAVIDDVGLARRVRASGRRTAVWRGDDVLSVHMYHGAAEIIRGFTKNMFMVLGRSYFWTLFSFVAGVLFHIVPYVLAVTGDMVSIVTVGVITTTRVILFQNLRYPLAYALFAHPLMVAFWGWISLRSAWVVGIRKQLAWRGRSYDPAQTRFGADR